MTLSVRILIREFQTELATSRCATKLPPLPMRLLLLPLLVLSIARADNGRSGQPRRGLNPRASRGAVTGPRVRRKGNRNGSRTQGLLHLRRLLCCSERSQRQ